MNETTTSLLAKSPLGSARLVLIPALAVLAVVTHVKSSKFKVLWF